MQVRRDEGRSVEAGAGHRAADRGRYRLQRGRGIRCGAKGSDLLLEAIGQAVSVGVHAQRVAAHAAFNTVAQSVGVRVGGVRPGPDRALEVVGQAVLVGVQGLKSAEPGVRGLLRQGGAPGAGTRGLVGSASTDRLCCSSRSCGTGITVGDAVAGECAVGADPALRCRRESPSYAP
jgi:hypothetical protein